MCCAGALFRSTSVREDLLGGGAGATPSPHPLLQQHSLPVGQPLPLSPPQAVRGGAPGRMLSSDLSTLHPDSPRLQQQHSLPVPIGEPLPMSPPPAVWGGARNGVFGRNPCNPKLPRLLQQHSLPAPMGELLPMSPPPAVRGSGLSRTVSNPNPDPQRLLHQHILPVGQPLPMSPPPAVRAGGKPELLDPIPSNPDPIGMDSHPDLGSLAELEAFWAAAQSGSIGSGRVGGEGSDPVLANTGPGAGAAGAGGELEESPQVDTPEGAYSLFPEGLQVRVSFFCFQYACLILCFPSFCR